MNFTLSTVPLCLLALCLLYRSRWDFIATAIFMSIFQASSVLNIGASIGVNISYLLLLCGIVKEFLTGRRDLRPSARTRDAILLLLAFFLYAAISAMLNPLIFRGVPYSNPKMGLQVPLQWEPSHLNQLFYLSLCVSLFIVCSCFRGKQQMSRALDWYIAGCCLASIIAFYQFASLRAGLPFPYDYIHTNPVYGIFEAYDIGGFARINSTFTEASAAGGAFVPALAILAWRLLHSPLWKDGISAILILCGLFLTISTLGYVSFGFLTALVFLVFTFQRPRDGHLHKSRLMVSAILAGSLLLLISLPAARTSGIALLDTVIFSKKQTRSYEERGQVDADAWQTARLTNWLGAGFGVCRGSSFIPTQFGGIGIPGMTLFAIFVLVLFKPAWRSRLSTIAFTGQPLMAAAVSLFSMAIAGPEITSPSLWLFFAACTLTGPSPSADIACPPNFIAPRSRRNELELRPTRLRSQPEFTCSARRF